MRLSTKSRFAVTAMIDMGMRQHQGPVSLAAISQRQHISISYLEQIFSKMRQHGLVESTRGPGGGYALGFRGDSISVADIVTAIESDEPSPAIETRKGAQDVPDMTEALWEQLHTALMAHMRTITLKSLALEQSAKGFKVPTRKSNKKGILKKPQTPALKTNAPNSVFALGQWLPSRG
jgi:Rrf2 family iron-sulfur cluster assembly transcriptional regulator